MVLAAVRRGRALGVVPALGAAAGCAVGLVAVAIAHHAPTGSFSGRSSGDGLLELAAGWSLVVVGVLFGLRRRNRCGPLLLVAGCASFLVEWSNPEAGSAFVFTIGLIGAVACAPVLAHVVLVYPNGRAGTAFDRAGIAAGYACALGLLGLVATATFDPLGAGCAACPANLALVHGDAGAYGAVLRWGLRMALGWATLAIVLTAVRLWRSREGLAVLGPVAVAGASYLALVAVDLGHSLDRGSLGSDPTDVRLWRLEAVALCAVAACVAWRLVAARRARALVARLVLELGRMQAPGGVRVALAGTLDDPSIELAYRSAESALYTDAYGRPVDVAADGRRAVTEVLHEGRPVAAVVHDRALLRDPGLMEEAVSAARIAIENERFGIEMTTQLERLRASRARIVAAGDEERRRLERDLHDGAQQRLVGLLLGLRMLRAQLPPAEQAKVDEAESGVRHALADLRSLAHGIFPAALADEGLAAAVELLVDQSKAEIAVRKLPRGRFTPAVETAAYLVVAETLDRTAPVQADVEASRLGNELVVEVWSDGRPTEPFTDLEDRVGALGGRLAVTDDQGVRVRAVLPCG